MEITPLEARQSEVDQYTANIAMYTAILETLPTEYPKHLVGFKGSKDKHAVIATVENLDDVELLSKLWQADDCRAAIRTEILERSKANSILAVLKSVAN
jgi:hypothetical protein